MIKSWNHKGLKKFFETGSKAGIQPKHANDLAEILFLLSAATKPEELDIPGFDFHQLKGNKKDFYAVKVNGNWSVIFKFEDQDAILVDYIDYH